MQVLEIWRYPVKSMLGEQLDQVEVGSLGVFGDRQRAVVDAESGVSLSAKRYAELLLCRAWMTGKQVTIGFPNGSEVPADSTEAADQLSDLLNRRVVVRTAQEVQTVRHEFPGDPPSGEGKAFIWEPGLEPFFDRSPLHLITTATLDEFSRVNPNSAFKSVRFRPNFLIETDEKGCVEDNWVGRELTIGTVKCHVLDHKPRCVMTTRPQSALPKDTDIMKTIVKTNEGRGGIELKTLKPGIVHKGDQAELQT